jgi:hypothetical protein
MKKLLIIILTLFSLHSFAQDTTIYVKVMGIPGAYNFSKSGDSLIFYVAGVRNALSVGSTVDLSNYYNKTQVDNSLSEKLDTSYKQSITAIKPLHWNIITPDSATIGLYVDTTSDLSDGSDTTVTTSKSVKNYVDGYVPHVTDIIALENYTGNSNTVIVRDSLRGGIFNYVANAIPDSGTVFKRYIGGYWKRQFSDAVNLNWFGAVPDGNDTTFSGTDNLNPILLGINASSTLGVTLVIDGKYFTSPFAISKNNVDILMKSGSYLIGNNISDTNAVVLTISSNINNVLISAYGAYLISPSYAVGEYRHNIAINGASNVTINGLTIIGSGGDGINIGSSSSLIPTNIRINDVHIVHAYRNGIALINGNGVYIVNPIIDSTKGKQPEAGIDIEPNSGIAEQLKGIKIVNPITRNNNGYGVLITPSRLVDSISKTMDVVVENAVSDSDGLNGVFGGLGIVGTGNLHAWNHKLSGTIKYSGIVRNSGGNGFLFDSMGDSSCKSYVNVYVENPGTTATDNLYRNGALIFAATGAIFPNGNLDLNIKTVDTRPIPIAYTGVYIDNTIQDIKNVNIKLDFDGRSIYAGGITGTAIASKKFIGTITYAPENVITTTASSSIKIYLGSTIYTNGSLSLNLPLASDVVGGKYFVKNIGTSLSNIVLAATDNFIFPTANTTQNIIVDLGQFYELEATLSGWRINKTNGLVRQNFANAATGYAPTYAFAIPTDGTWKKGNIVWNSNATGNIGWICTTAGTPGTWAPFGSQSTTANKALISDANGLPSASSVTNTELSYLSGSTSSIQTQLNTKAIDANTVHMTGNEVPVNKWIKNSYFAIGGDLTDLGMTGLFDRNELTNADLRGIVTANKFDSVAGTTTALTSSVVRTLFDASANFSSITTHAGDSLAVVIDLGSSVSLYGHGAWQPFVGYRLPYDIYKNISVWVSTDNSTWTQPSGWNYTYPTAFFPDGYWFGSEGVPGITWRYAKFVFKNPTSLGGVVYLSEIGIRHISAPYARQYALTAGDDFWGQMNFHNTTDAAGNFATINPSTGALKTRTASEVKTDLGFTTGTAAPTTTPASVNLFFLDVTNKKLYVSTGTTSSADWTILN